MENNDNEINTLADLTDFIGSTASPGGRFKVSGRVTGSGTWRSVEAAKIGFSMTTRKNEEALAEGEEGAAEIAEFFSKTADILVTRLAGNRATVTVTPEGEDPVSSTGPYTSSGEFKITGIKITVGDYTAKAIAFKRSGQGGVNTTVGLHVGVFWGFITFSPL